MLQHNRIRYLIRRGSEENCGPTLSIVSNTTSLMCKKTQLTNHYHSYEPGLWSLNSRDRMSPGGLSVDAVFSADEDHHTWLNPHYDPHWPSVWSHLCQLVSSLLSAVFICSVPSWELAASAQQLQGAWSWTKTGQKTLTQRKEKKAPSLRLKTSDAYCWNI